MEDVSKLVVQVTSESVATAAYPLRNRGLRGTIAAALEREWLSCLDCGAELDVPRETA